MKAANLDIVSLVHNEHRLERIMKNSREIDFIKICVEIHKSDCTERMKNSR